MLDLTLKFLAAELNTCLMARTNSDFGQAEVGRRCRPPLPLVRPDVLPEAAAFYAGALPRARSAHRAVGRRPVLTGIRAAQPDLGLHRAATPAVAGSPMPVEQFLAEKKEDAKGDARKEAALDGAKTQLAARGRADVRARRRQPNRGGAELEFDERGKRAGGVPKFKDATTKYGFTPRESGWDVDHVVELQIEGQDVTENLWPLPAGENRSSGAIIKSANVTLPGKKEWPLSKALEKRPKKTQGLGMMVASTRQR